MTRLAKLRSQLPKRLAGTLGLTIQQAIPQPHLGAQAPGVVRVLLDLSAQPTDKHPQGTG